MEKPETSSAETRRFAFYWAAAGVLELPLLALMTSGPLPVPAWLGVLGHVAAAGLVFFGPPKGKGWLLPTRHWGAPLALLTLLVPGFGWAASGWLALKHRQAPHAKDAYRFEDPAGDDVNPLAGVGTPDAIRRELAEALDVLPAVDALLSRSSELKRGAIETLSRIRTREAVSWIFKARSDIEPEVRFYATTALTRLKRDFETAIQAAERELYRKPGEPANLIALQRIRYEYAVSGMLEAAARDSLLKEARLRLETLAERQPDAARLLFLVERELDPRAAEKRLAKLEADDSKHAARWRRERVSLLFSTGRYRELAAILPKAGETLVEDDDRSIEAAEWRAACLWWSA